MALHSYSVLSSNLVKLDKKSPSEQDRVLLLPLLVQLMFGRGFPEAWQTSVVLPPSMMGEVNGYLAISGRSLK